MPDIEFRKTHYEKVNAIDCMNIYRADNDILISNWYGSPTPAQAKLAYWSILESCMEQDIWKVITDNSRLRTPWKEADSWAAKFFIPKMIESGLKKVAYVYKSTPNLFDHANRLLSIPMEIEIQMFNDFKTASYWMTGELMTPPVIYDRITLKTEIGVRQISIDDIIYFAKEDGRTVLVTETEKIGISKTLSDMEQFLPPEIFFRAHKSYLVNVEKIVRLEYTAGGYYKAYFQHTSDETVTISRNSVTELKEIISRS